MRTKGTIVDTKKIKKRLVSIPVLSSGQSSNDTLFYPVISFQTMERKKVKFTSQYYSKSPEKYAVGKEVIVEYDHKNPLDVRHIENNPEGMSIKVKIALGVAALIAIILIAVFL